MFAHLATLAQYEESVPRRHYPESPERSAKRPRVEDREAPRTLVIRLEQRRCKPRACPVSAPFNGPERVLR